MDDFQCSFRSSGVRERKLEIVNGRDFSTRYHDQAFTPDPPTKAKPNKSKLSSSSSSSSPSWGFNDAEMKRRKRVAGYKIYAVEGKVKASFRKGFRWIKEKYADIVHG